MEPLLQGTRKVHLIRAAMWLLLSVPAKGWQNTSIAICIDWEVLMLIKNFGVVGVTKSLRSGYEQEMDSHDHLSYISEA